MNDWIRRGIRTAIQVGLPVAGWGVVKAFVSITPEQDRAVMQLIVPASAVVLSLVMNAAEDGGVIPALLKSPASPGANPVPDPGPGRDLESHPSNPDN